MTLPRTVADVLSEHVVFEVECIDRMYLNVYVPQLQYATGLVSYIHRQLGMPVASTAALAPVSEAFTRSVRSFAASCGIPWVDFAKGQRKDDVALEFLAGFTGTEGVLFIGRAQEKVPLFRTRKRRRADGSSYPWIAAETGVVSQYYCYCVDEDFGPFFLKFCSYFPFNAKLCIFSELFKITKVGVARLSFVLLARGGDGAAGNVGEAGYAEVDGGAPPGEIVELAEFLPGGGEADLQAVGLAEPAFALGFADAGLEVVA